MAALNPIIPPTGNEVIIKGQQFTDISGAIAFTGNVASATERRALFESIGEHIEKRIKEMEEAVYELYEAIEQDSAMKDVVKDAITNDDDQHHSLWVAVSKSHLVWQDRLRRTALLRATIL